MFQRKRPLRTASSSCGRVMAFFMNPPPLSLFLRACYHINLVRSCGSRWKPLFRLSWPPSERPKTQNYCHFIFVRLFWLRSSIVDPIIQDNFLGPGLMASGWRVLSPRFAQRNTKYLAWSLAKLSQNSHLRHHLIVRVKLVTWTFWVPIFITERLSVN
jgi:hypothetical protein